MDNNVAVAEFTAGRGEVALDDVVKVSSKKSRVRKFVEYDYQVGELVEFISFQGGHGTGLNRRQRRNVRVPEGLGLVRRQRYEFLGYSPTTPRMCWIKVGEMPVQTSTCWLAHCEPKEFVEKPSEFPVLRPMSGGVEGRKGFVSRVMGFFNKGRKGDE